MIALAFALSLIAADGPDELGLPRSLSVDESRFLPPEPAAAWQEAAWWLGPHLGVAGAYDLSNPGLLIGGTARAHILPWLGAEVSIDFQTSQAFESNQIHVFQVPFEFSVIFYVPIESPFRPYAAFGAGFSFMHVSYSGGLAGSVAHTNLEALCFIGFGAEIELNPDIMLDMNLRIVPAHDPTNFGGNNVNWIQFSMGILFRLAH